MLRMWTYSLITGYLDSSVYNLILSDRQNYACFLNCYPDKARCGNLSKYKVNFSPLNSFKEMIWSFHYIGHFSIVKFTKFWRCSRQKKHIFFETPRHKDVYITFSEISTSEIFRTAFRLNLICIFLSVRHRRAIKSRVQTSCRVSFQINKLVCIIVMSFGLK